MVKLPEDDNNVLENIIKENKHIKFQDNNPKRKGGSYNRYEKYKSATNYKEFLELSGNRVDFKNDYEKKYFKLVEQQVDLLSEIPSNEKNISFDIKENNTGNIDNLVAILHNDFLNELYQNNEYFIKCIKQKLNIEETVDNVEEDNVDKENEEEEDMNEYIKQPMLTYIGNKRKLINDIEKIIINLKEDIGKGKLVLCDLFAGSGVVSRMMHSHSCKLISNDLEKYSYSVCKAYLDKPSNTDIKKINDHIDKMNNIAINGPFNENGIISNNYAPKDTNNILEGERCFYTRENALIIDTLREYIKNNVEEYLKDYCLAPLLVKSSINNNTAGVQKGFYKDKHTGIGAWGGTGANSNGRITKRIVLDKIIWSEHNSDIHCYNKDSNQLIKELDNDIDICYIDPPYNQHPYSANYHILNTIYVNQIDTSTLSKVVGIPNDWTRSVYNKEQSAITGMTDLLKGVMSKCKYAILSYNNEGIIPVKILEEILSTYNYKKNEIKYDTYKGCRNLKGRSDKVIEIMYTISNK
jgi:adenine-specific DNA-methyltransferase